jgi:hypothetical protein
VGQLAAGIFSSTSLNSGQRPVAFFEKINWPSSSISSCPPEPLMNVASMPRAFLISAARLVARGR